MLGNQSKHKRSFINSLAQVNSPLPAHNTCASGIPVCILVLKKCKKFDDVLFINASADGHFEKGKRQNRLREDDISEIIKTYTNRPKHIERYTRSVSMQEIEKNDFNLNISRYVSTAIDEEIIDLKEVHDKLADIEKKAKDAAERHNGFLRELGLDPI